MYKCQICNKEFKSKSTLHAHLSIHHNYTRNDILQYDIKYLGLTIPKCPICGKTVKLHIGASGRLFDRTCGDENCKKELYKRNIQKYYQEHPEALEKHRKDRINYLSDKHNFEKTAWGLRANNKFTFLEQWFVDNILIPYKLGQKFDIINEYEIYPYFIDFCFLNNKVCVELDGRCHFENGNKRIDHDIIRDKKLIEKGWHVYHISYNEVEQNPEKTIEDFINYISQQKIIEDKKYNASAYQKYDIIKKEKEKQYLQNKTEKLNNRNLELEKRRNYFIDLEQNSGIDFSKFGWVDKALRYLKTKYNFELKQLHREILNCYPEFFKNNKVFLRKSAKIIEFDFNN